MNKRKGFWVMKPHVRVGIVTTVLIASGVAVLVVSLTSLRRVDDHVTKLRSQAEGSRQDLLAVERGLTQRQAKFVAIMTEPDKVKRILLIEDIRRQLSADEAAWTHFKSVVLHLPGEQELVNQFDALQAELVQLEGPVGFLLLNVDDASPLWNDKNVGRLRQIQDDSLAIAQRLDTGFYQPMVRAEVDQAAAEQERGYRDVWLAFAAVMAVSIPLAFASFVTARHNERTTREEQARRAE